jgi:DNA primase
MRDEQLVNLVDSVLGEGKETSKGNQAYMCPFCHHQKPKFEINFTENNKDINLWNCWVCNKRGNRLSQLFKKLKVHPNKIDELRSLQKVYHIVGDYEVVSQTVALPEEYKTLQNSTDIIAKQARVYLKSRNINDDEIIKYNIGYCEYGDYANMLIFPSYDKHGNLNYFTSRSFKRDSFIKYKNPNFTRDVVPFELFINWDLPIILCEGPFDAVAIKRNVIPLLGKNIQPALMKQIIKSNVKQVYIALDNDAIKQALEHAERLIDEGKEVYLIEMEGKDPSDIGFKEFHRLMNRTKPTNLYSIMKLKLSML